MQPTHDLPDTAKPRSDRCPDGFGDLVSKYNSRARRASYGRREHVKREVARRDTAWPHRDGSDYLGHPIAPETELERRANDGDR